MVVSLAQGSLAGQILYPIRRERNNQAPGALLAWLTEPA